MTPRQRAEHGVDLLTWGAPHPQREIIIKVFASIIDEAERAAVAAVATRDIAKDIHEEELREACELEQERYK